MYSARRLFRQRVRRAIANSNLQTALDNNADRRKAARSQAYASLPVALDVLREQAHSIRQEVIHNLEHYLEQFIQNLEMNGFRVSRAANGEEARQLVIQIAQAHHARLIAKSKSMVSEEIHINHALEQVGVRSIETDLGEFIIQLRGEPSAHIITPAVHLRCEDVAKTFGEKLGMPYTTDVKILCDVARRELREIFLTADIGLSGVNFGVAESGALCMVTNEGNGRMVTTIPPVHVALMGMERLVPTWNDLDIMLQLLSRSATGQKLTNYVSLIRTPRRPGEPDGPQERHLILVDNGRSALASSSIAESLLCIRCGACLNACPVFRELGGHAYDSPYPGPIGSLVSPSLFGISNYGHLSKASTLCGICSEACPVNIDFTTLFLRVRDQYVQQAPQPLGWRLGMWVYTWVMERPWAYHFVQKFTALGTHLLPSRDGWMRWLPPPATAWTKSREFPRFAHRPFRVRFKEMSESGIKTSKRSVAMNASEGLKILQPTQHDIVETPDKSQSTIIERFAQELEALGGEFIPCTESELMEKVTARLHKLGVRKLITSDSIRAGKDDLIRYLNRSGFTLLDPNLPADEQRQEHLYSLSQAEAGLTGAIAALADTGTLVVPGGVGRSLLSSLLPPIHLAVLHVADIYPCLADWLKNGGKQILNGVPNTALISGPSRTADIEMTLTIGVHGPGQVIVFCY
jgi:L-lactate dehydrogenase complex protein LldF